MYPDYALRAQLLLAIVLIHELAHAVGFLRFYDIMTGNKAIIFTTKGLDVYWHANTDKAPNMHEWGFELEAALLGGGSLVSGTQEEPFRVAPLYGLTFEDLYDYLRTNGVATRFYLVDCNWDRWWFV